MPETPPTRSHQAVDGRQPFVPKTRELFVPKTSEMDPVELKRQMDARLKSVEAAEAKLAEPARAAIRELRNPRATREGLKRHLMALVVALSQTSFFSEDLVIELDAIPPTAETTETDSRRDGMGSQEQGRIAETVRNRERRHPLWQSYVKLVNVADAVDAHTEQDEEGNRVVTATIRPDRIRTNVLEKLDGRFTELARPHLQRAVEQLFAQKDLPTTSEDSAIAVDRVMLLTMRAAHAEASSKGIKANLLAAEGAIMELFAYTIRDYVRARPGMEVSRVFTILEALKERMHDKWHFEQQIPGVSSLGLPETWPVTDAIANVKFDLLLGQHEEQVMPFLETCPSGDIGAILMTHLEWFKAHREEVKRSYDVRTDVIAVITSIQSREAYDERRSGARVRTSLTKDHLDLLRFLRD